MKPTRMSRMDAASDADRGALEGSATAPDPPAAESGAPVLRLDVRGISKTYGAIKALSEVDFELRPGEIMALLGENGAGKSTLVNVLSGLVVPDTGTIAIDGQLAELSTAHKSQAAGVAVVHQEFSSVRTMSIAENIALDQWGDKHFWTGRQLAAHARPILETVGLGHLDPLTPVERLSVAETQLVEVARAVARDARIVIFDEPTAALAENEIDLILTLIKRLASQGRSIVYVTHRLPEVFKLADRVTVFRNGRSGSPVPVSELDVPRVVSMMLGREATSMFPERGTLRQDDPVLKVNELQVAGLKAPVSFTAHRGEILGLTGQLGSGATAVLEALAGLTPVGGGDAELSGTALDLRSRASGIRRRVAYCSPNRKLDGIFAERPIRENLSAPWLKRVATYGWLAGRDEDAEARKIAETFTIDTARLRSPVMTLSGGNQQKVVLGKWLGTDPTLLLVDEPTRGVDVGARGEIYHRLRELCAGGMTIIVASSDTEEVLGLCDTIVTFYHGRLQSAKPWSDWNEHSLVQELMHSEVIA